MICIKDLIHQLHQRVKGLRLLTLFTLTAVTGRKVDNDNNDFKAGASVCNACPILQFGFYATVRQRGAAALHRD